ncbi:MAG: flagellar motor protein MotB [Chitinophagaceae bacterium]|nr:MAG: flagellar motor protein MotB [Chitinophagaceae bacterium]
MSALSIFKGNTAALLSFTLLASAPAFAQKTVAARPIWWFGESGAVNMNHYRGMTQSLNNAVYAPTAFHKGNGVKPYVSLLAEYRPGKVWGGMLNLAFDNRGGKFDAVMAPCNCPAELATNLSYVAIEPSLRVAPFSSSFYVFAGPAISINVSRSFTYAQDKQTEKSGDWSNVRKTLLSAQAGAGIDIPLSKPDAGTQMTLSPFASFLTNFGHNPRSEESWSVYTVRAGMAIKFGVTPKAARLAKLPDNTQTVSDKNTVLFSVRAPKVVAINRRVKETFPLRNSVFFDNGSVEIPNRYVKLNNSAEGKMMAESVKSYLVAQFGINPSRIVTEGRDKPVIPSEQPGASRELALLKAGDRRVDIVSTSPGMFLQVGGSASPFLKPVQIIAVQEDPLDSHVVFTNTGATRMLKSWSVDLTDDQGRAQHYGPFTGDQASVPGKTILNGSPRGNYTVQMRGVSNNGSAIVQRSVVSLEQRDERVQEGLRYSILFDFDQSRSVASYEKFLTDIIAPMITSGSLVSIHGHTDNIGEETYNQTLSQSRATGTQSILAAALARAGKSGVQFQTYGFGEDLGMSPFENGYPEERFYNRTVIIDILPMN